MKNTKISKNAKNAKIAKNYVEDDLVVYELLEGAES